MRPLVVLASSLLMIASTATSAAAQTGTLPIEAAFGWVHRAASVEDRAEDGVQATVRIGARRGRVMRLLVGLDWTRLPDQERITPSYCPQPAAPCPARRLTLRGVGMLGTSVGLEALLRAPGFEVRPSVLLGGYALYHRADHVPGLAAGLDLGASLGLPIGTHERILLEGRWLRLAGRAGGAANGRRLSLGLALH